MCLFMLFVEFRCPVSVGNLCEEVFSCSYTLSTGCRANVTASELVLLLLTWNNEA